MEIRRGGGPTAAGPADWFTGAVHIDQITTPAAPSRLSAAVVRFAPRARTAWHTHPLGQTIHVTDGVCLLQRRGGPIEEIRAGDTAVFAPGEDHWHGAAPDRHMTHIAMMEADGDGVTVNWGDRVTDEQYAPGT